MILIFGGAYQGKLSYVLERFQLTMDDLYKCTEFTELPEPKKIIYNIDQWILALIKKDQDPLEAIHQLTAEYPDAIIVCNDISCGIVPTDPIMRKWREAVGKSLVIISKQSEEVIRLFCGIPTTIKG